MKTKVVILLLLASVILSPLFLVSDTVHASITPVAQDTLNINTEVVFALEEYLFIGDGSNLKVYSFDGSDFSAQIDSEGLSSTINDVTARNVSGTIYVYTGHASNVTALTFDGTAFTKQDYDTTNTVGNLKHIACNDSYLFTSRDNGNISAYSFDGATLTYINCTGTDCDGGIACNDEYIFGYDNDQSKTISLSFDGTSFTQIDTDSEKMYKAGAMIYGDYLVYGQENDVEVTLFNISTGSLLGKKTASEAGAYPVDVYIYDLENIYVANMYKAYCQIYSFDGSTFTNAGSFSSIDGADAITGAGNYLYVAESSSDGITAFTITEAAGNSPCTSTGYEYGNWSHSEHINGTDDFEESWIVENSSAWNGTDESIWWSGNYTLSFNGSASNHSYAMFNNSGMNRTQRFGWVHSNDTEVDAMWPYVIFAYENASSFDCVMWSSTEIWMLHWNGTNMTDVYTGDIVVTPSVDATDISDQWIQEGVYLTDEGNYWKLIYNELNGTLKFKWWGGGFMNEPVGWATDYIHANITYTTCKCQGVGVWNPNARETYMQWDLLNVWQLNYTVNTSAWCNISGNNVSRPHMDFPVIDLGTWSEEIMSYFNATADGNMTIDNIRSIMKDNITNPMNMESRMFELKSLDNGQQNDTVYYYSCVLDNFTAFAEESFDEWLHLHVQMCPEDDIETDEYGDFMVAIDVDNDRTWDARDRFYWGYIDDLGDVWFQSFDGNGAPKANIAACNIWESDTDATGNLHRYGSHLNYAISIPLADLVKTNGEALNSSDLFGLHISTTTSGMVFTTQDPCVWQNWNETTESTYIDEENNMANVVEYFLNCTGEMEGYVANDTNLKRWGEGEIGAGLQASGELSYNMSVNASFNMSSSTAEEGYVHVNTTINVTNDGAGSLTGIYVNITWWNCSCSDLNMTLVESNQDISNWTWYNDSCYAIIHNVSNEPLTAGNTWNIWFIVNVTNCSGVTTGVGTMNVTVNATELDEDVTLDGDDVPSFAFGIAATQVCIRYLTGMANAEGYGGTVFAIIGAIISIGAILSLIAIFKGFKP